MSLCGCQIDIIIACVVVNYSQSSAPQVIYALWSLCCMSVISDVREREGKGGEMEGEKKERRGDEGKKVSKLQIVWIRDGCFFFLFLATTLHTVTQLLED